MDNLGWSKKESISVDKLESVIDNNNKYRINAFDIGLQTGLSFDCTSLLQAKIDELYNLGGGIIEFPSGSYYFKGTIMLRPKVQIQGVSDTTDFISSSNIHGTVFYHNPDTLSDFFILDDTHKYAGYVESIVVKNLRIFGKENYSNVCMNLQGIAHSNIENISMSGFNKDLKISDSMTTTFRNLKCINAGDTILEVTKDITISTTTNFYDCYFGQSYSGKALVVNANSCLNCNFINCVFESTQEGLFIETGNIVSFNNIYIENIPCVTIEGTNPTAPAINIGLNSNSNLTSELIFNGGFIAGGNSSIVANSKLVNTNYINKLAFIGVQFARAESLINMTDNTKRVVFISCNEVQITNGLCNSTIRNKCDIIGCYSSAYGKKALNSLQDFSMNGYQIKNEYFRTPNDFEFVLEGESTPTLMMDNNKNVQLFGRNTNYNAITGGGAFIVNPTNPQVLGTLNSSLMYAKEVDGEIVLHEFTSKYNNKPILFVNSGTSDKRPTTGRYIGLMYFDTTLNKPIWYNGTTWVDVNGTTV